MAKKKATSKKKSAAKKPAKKATKGRGAKGKSPAHQAKQGSPVNGVIPPPEHRWKPGQSGNPKGRPAFGAAVREWLDALQDATQAELIQIVRAPASPRTKVTAAIRILRSCQTVNVADFDPVISGEMTLAELAKSGVDVSVVKRVARKETKYGPQISLEFHDWSGVEFDRIMDRTVGRPEQAVTGKDGGPIQTQNVGEEVVDPQKRQLALALYDELYGGDDDEGGAG